MKKIVLTFLLLLCCAMGVQAQTNQFESVAQSASEPKDGAVYKLFPTQNVWTFIKLDTRNGRMWQVQYSVSGDRFEAPMSLDHLCSMSEQKNGRFTLYSTANMYNFILLDQIDGRCWQAQWSDKPENRGVLRIY